MIAIDWGTTSFRAYRLSAEGAVVEERSSADGILSVKDFPAVLAAQIRGWTERPIVMSGMVGSRQGWKEVPYVQCPAGARELYMHMTEVAPQVWIVPGVSCVDEAGVPDVMRGEETQILGVLQDLEDDSLVCLPGTHSKWVHVRGDRIVGVRTYFTGELFSVLKQHSLLGRMMEDGPADESSFAEGIDRSADEGGLLNHLFGVRTRGLFGEIGNVQAASYLSGLLIGHELRAIAPKRPFGILGAPELAARYERAAALLGFKARRLDSLAAPRGLFALIRKTGL